ncbi:MAG TPA: hypothetical protein VF970_00045 [Gemmatimonadales bacterium]
MELDGHGLPRLVKEVGEERREDARRDQEGKRVEAVGEVWRVDDEWWREPIGRRYVEVTLEGGAHLVLFEDLATGSWFAQRI